MGGTGQVVKELLLELAQTERKIIPPFQTEKLQRAQQEIKEHNKEMTRLIHEAESKVRLCHRAWCRHLSLTV
jgi:alanine-alpha-ketoisovalerate/valine-pyruvate aminotransferase